MISTVCAISERAGVSAWMVSAFLRIARIVTGMDIHLRRRGQQFVTEKPTVAMHPRGRGEVLPVNNFGDEFVSAN